MASTTKKRRSQPRSSRSSSSDKASGKQRGAMPPKKNRNKLSYHFVRQPSGNMVYHNVPEEHIIPLHEEFKKSLSQHHPNHASVNAFYARHNSTSAFDVQCEFVNKVPSQTKPLVQRREAKTDRFELRVAGNCYKPTLGNNITTTGWNPVRALLDHQNTVSASPFDVKAFVLEYLKSSQDDNFRAFQTIIQEQELLIGPCQTKSTEKPCIFAYENCWRKTYTRIQLLSMLFPILEEGTAYRADNAHRPSDPSIGEDLHTPTVIQLIKGREPGEIPHCILNLPLGEHMGIQIPSILGSGVDKLSSESSSVSANMTPEGCFIDMHIDHGKHALSTPDHESTKLWALYPPTSCNLDAFYKMGGQEAKFARLALILEGGRCAITTNGATLYMPPGWLHATLTVRGGILLGVNWTRSSDQHMLANILIREIKADKNDAWYEPLLDSCELSFAIDETLNEEELNKRRKEVLLTLCPLFKQIGEIAKKDKAKKSPLREWSKLFGQLNKVKTCPRCEEPVSSHIKLVTVKR